MLSLSLLFLLLGGGVFKLNVLKEVGDEGDVMSCTLFDVEGLMEDVDIRGGLPDLFLVGLLPLPGEVMDLNHHEDGVIDFEGGDLGVPMIAPAAALSCSPAASSSAKVLLPPRAFLDLS